MGTDVDEAEAVRRLLNQPERTIGDALLDQRNLAGIGTIYRCETLFLSGVDPWTPVGEVRNLPRVVHLARRLLNAHRDRIAGGAQLWVYGRAGRPCRRCGSQLRRADMENLRLVVWCPSCQAREQRGGGSAVVR
jgi:endonuclease-8